MTEAELLKHCMLEVAKCGAWAWRNNRGMFLSLDGNRKQRAGLQVDGSSDLIGFTADGKFLAIEVKTETGRVSLEQQRFIDLVNKNGGVAFVARSIQDVRDNLL